MKSKVLVSYLLTVSCLFINACQSVDNDYNRYYIASGIDAGNFKNERVEVQLNETLNTGGIVIQMSDVSLYTAKSNRWAVGLDTQIKALVSDKIKDIDFFKDKKVFLFVSEFNGTYDGYATVSFNFKITDSQGKILQDKNVSDSIAVENNGYEALVTGLKLNLTNLIGLCVESFI